MFENALIFCLLPNHANFSFANLQQYYLKVGVGMKTSNKPHTRKGKNIKIVISTFYASILVGNH